MSVERRTFLFRYTIKRRGHAYGHGHVRSDIYVEAIIVLNERSINRLYQEQPFSRPAKK